MFQQNIKLLLAIAVSFISSLTGCKKDTAEDPFPAPHSTLLKELTTNDQYIRFSYNADSTIQSVITNTLDSGMVITYKVEYTDDKKIALLQANNGKKIVPVYEDGIIKRTDYYEGDIRVGYGYYLFENQQLKNASYYKRIAEAEYVPVFSFAYEYTQAGLIKEAVLMGEAEVPNLLRRKGHSSYEYDDKNNPLYRSKDLLLLFFQAVSKQNVVKEDHYNALLQVDGRTQYSYQYNNQSFPVSAELTIGLGAPYSNERINYAY